MRVSPLANDIDPTGGTLALSDIRPDVPATLDDGSAEPGVSQRIGDADRSRSRATVEIEAGDDPARCPSSTTSSESGNTGRGLIVVKVVREACPTTPSSPTRC